MKYQINITLLAFCLLSLTPYHSGADENIQIIKLTTDQIILEIESEPDIEYEILYTPSLGLGFFSIETFVGTGQTEVRNLMRADFPESGLFALVQAPFKPDSGRVSIRVEDPDSSTTLTPENIQQSHPWSGKMSAGWNEAGWDVDHHAPLSIDMVKTRINNADAWASEANGPPDSNPADYFNRLLDRYHFWPNVINLSNIFIIDPQLYESISTKIIDRENPTQRQRLKSWMDESIKISGHRIIIARDFLTIVRSENRTYFEVHFSIIINLDEKSVVEIQSHGRESDGIGLLSDPRIDDLQRIFDLNHPLGVLAEVWDICLRGNFNIYKRNALNIDRLRAGAGAEYYINRMELTCCGGSTQSAFPELPDETIYPCVLIGMPMALKRPQDIPLMKLPSRNPGQPNGGPDPNGNNGNNFSPIQADAENDLINPYPAPANYGEDFLPPDLGQTSGRPETGGSSPECPPGNPDQIIAILNAKLSELEMSYSQHLNRYNSDANTFNQNFRWGWPEENTEINFEHPELQELYRQFQSEVDRKRAHIATLRTRADQARAPIEEKRLALGTLGLMSDGMRGSLWENMITIGGEWSRVSINCIPEMIPSGGIPADQVVVISPEMQRDFQRDLYYKLMEGATWDEAVEFAVSQAPGDAIMNLVWQGYAKCLKQLAVRQLRIFLSHYLEPDQLETGIRVMFEGESALPPTLAAGLRELRDCVRNSNAQRLEIFEKIRECERTIEALWNEFYLALGTINASSRAIHRDHDQKIWILQAFAAYLAQGGFDLSNPDDPAAPKYISSDHFCRILRQMLEDPQCAEIPCLPHFLSILIRENC